MAASLGSGARHLQTNAGEAKTASEKVVTGELATRLVGLKMATNEKPTAGDQQSAAEILAGYMDAPKSGKEVTALLGRTLRPFYMEIGTAKSAAQVSHLADEARVRADAIQIAQNQRIIELREQIAKQTAGKM